MRKERTHYDRAFKEHSVKLSFERTNITEFARELGGDPRLIHRWRKDYQSRRWTVELMCRALIQSLPETYPKATFNTK